MLKKLLVMGMTIACSSFILISCSTARVAHSDEERRQIWQEELGRYYRRCAKESTDKRTTSSFDEYADKFRSSAAKLAQKGSDGKAAFKELQALCPDASLEWIERVHKL